MQDKFDFLFNKGQPYTKIEALFDLMQNPELLENPSRNNKLLHRWNWANTKTVARFIQILEEKSLLPENNKLLSQEVSQNGIEKKKDFKLLAHQVPEEEIADPTIYRQIDHLKLTIAQFGNLVSLGYKQEQVDFILDDIQNYSYNHKYKDLYITTRKWLLERYGDPTQKSLFPEQEN